MPPTQPWQLGPSVPQTGRLPLRWLGLGVMQLTGWRFTGAFPDLERFVVIVAPHTSNWDFPILLAAKWALQVDVSWMGKDVLFRPPLGWFLRAIGGIPVQRDATHNVVTRSVAAFGERKKLVLVLAPEGTRKRVTQWKSGFWHIAKGAGVPIVCVALDYSQRVIRLGPTFDTGDMDAESGIAKIRASYAGVLGLHPELQG